MQNVFVKWYFSGIYFLFDFVSYFPVCILSWYCPFLMYFVPYLFLWFWSTTVSRSFIHGAGGWVNFVLYKGAWLSIHSRMILFQGASWSFGLSNLFAIENVSCLKSYYYILTTCVIKDLSILRILRPLLIIWKISLLINQSDWPYFFKLIIIIYY